MHFKYEWNFNVGISLASDYYLKTIINKSYNIVKHMEVNCTIGLKNQIYTHTYK